MKKFIFISLISAALMVSSCKKKGCIDSNAENYCEKCKKDDGSCTYKAAIQFWYDKTVSDVLIANGVTSVTIYIDGAVVGSYAANVYFTGDPSCSQSSVVRSEKKLGKDKTKTAAWKVLDQDGIEIPSWSGSIIFDSSKSCTSYQLQ